jgi:hypothetical protein
VFWQAGRNFAIGHPLYQDSLPGARPLKYPSFAALVFQLLALFPLQVAAALISLLNSCCGWWRCVSLACLRHARTPAAAAGSRLRSVMGAHLRRH